MLEEMDFKTYETMDFALAAALVCNGFELIGTTLGNRGKRNLVLKLKKGVSIEKAVAEFISGKMTVDPKGFLDTYQHVKMMVNSQITGGRGGTSY